MAPKIGPERPRCNTVRRDRLARPRPCGKDGDAVSDADVLILDNRDSFVWNLAQAFEVLGLSVSVVRSDRIDIDAIRTSRARSLVMSPGPGRPEDAGVCIAAVRALADAADDRPVLGVCLGHQVLAAAFGATVERGAPCHGKTRTVRHDGRGVFRDLPTPFAACRYHSLQVDADTLPADLRVCAWSEDGVVMGLRHRTRPLFGVQFHPESFRTEHGPHLLANFAEVLA
jgi:anthranilate synthase component 2